MAQWLSAPWLQLSSACIQPLHPSRPACSKKLAARQHRQEADLKKLSQFVIGLAVIQVLDVQVALSQLVLLRPLVLHHMYFWGKGLGQKSWSALDSVRWLQKLENSCNTMHSIESCVQDVEQMYASFAMWQH